MARRMIDRTNPPAVIAKSHFSGCGDSEVMNFVFHSCVGGTCGAEILPVRALSLFFLRRPGWQLSLR